MSIIDGTGRDAVERRLRHAVIQHFLDAERGIIFSMPAIVICSTPS